jgi:Holliday junction DNA helicase RuvA
MAAKVFTACGEQGIACGAGVFSDCTDRDRRPCDNARVAARPALMIGRLSGTLVEKNPPQILLDVQGVAYEVDVPMSTFYNLPSLGERISLFTHLVVREDAHLLFGFGSESERRAFRQLIKISGIGARTALSVLSGLSVAELAQAVTMQETGRLTKIPGIGKKTAERLLLELKDKLGVEVTSAIGVNRAPPVVADVLNALVALGYSDKEAVHAVKQLPDGVAVADGIRQALKVLAKA